VYAGLIQPIFDAKCTGCHGEKKQKGKLQVHTLELLLKGGDSGEKTVVAGKSAESLIIKRAALPADEDEHMPPKDKDQLTEKEVKILKWWIDGGLKNDVKIKDSGLPAELK
jgi:mono/diheme cytochrome c family protein